MELKNDHIYTPWYLNGKNQAMVQFEEQITIHLNVVLSYS